MLQKVKTFINKNKMLTRGDRVVIGVSGGADSVCLFFIMLKLKEIYDLGLFVVHVNHGIRGKEADDDEAFVKALCDQYKICYEAIHVDVKNLAKNEGLSEEEAARNLRYLAFSKVCNKHYCHKIAVAHNENDQAETVLFQMFRGSGLRGLTGMAPVRDKIIRPLLCLSRKEIELFLSAEGIEYRTDQTNLEEIYTRNKIRRKILPYVGEKINAKAVEHIAQSAAMLREIERYISNNAMTAYEKMVERTNGQYSLDIKLFLSEDKVIQKEIIRKVIEQIAGHLKNFDSEHIEKVLSLTNKQVGKQTDLPYGISAVKKYDQICFYIKKGMEFEEEPEKENIKVEIPGEYQLLWRNITISFRIQEYKKNMIIPKKNCTKWFDYDKIKNTVFIRNREKDDYLQIDSNGNRKKLKAYFIDKKIPKEERDQIPLLADGNHIIWVIGDRISEAYKVGVETNRILIVEIIGGIQDG